ncbi:MAG: XRE family transcriptional regulator [Verrucomicrobiota bacterium]
MENVFGERLKQARAMAGLSLRGLSDAMGGAVSYNALSKYEKGEMLPSSKVLIELASVLKRNQDFFFMPIDVRLEKIKFRKYGTKVSKTDGKRIEAEAEDYFGRYLTIEHILDIEKPFKNPLGSGFVVDSPEKAEEAATLLRKSWGLGAAPLPSVAGLLEEKGIKVFEMPDAPDGFDGFSARSNGVAMIVVGGNSKNDLTRKRMTLLHELGHLLFTIPDSVSHKDEEMLMTRFAGACLVPSSVMFDRIGEKRSKVAVQEYKDLKALYGISISALVVRADQLGITPHSYTKSFWIMRRKWGWDKTGEPGMWQGAEFPLRFNGLVYRALAEGMISISKSAALLDCSINDLRAEQDIA